MSIRCQVIGDHCPAHAPDAQGSGALPATRLSTSSSNLLLRPLSFTTSTPLFRRSSKLTRPTARSLGPPFEPTVAKFAPVAFYTRTLPHAELNYDTHDTGLLAIFEAFKTW